MKLLKPPVVALIVAAFLLVSNPAAGQELESQQPPKLSLKVIIYEGSAPTYYPLGDADKSFAAAEFRDFRRLDSSRRLGGAPVERITLCFSREGASARATVYAFRAGANSTGSEIVAQFVIGEEQEHAITQLTNLGVEPFRVSLVRRAEVKISPPEIQNKTQAVEVTEIKFHEKVPSFELTFRNVSDKDIRAVDIQEMRGWKPKGSPPHFNWRGMSLIKPGEVWKVTLEFGWNHKMTPEGHVIEPPDKVAIDTVLFSDGSYEGQPSFAAKAEAFKAGRRIQLARALDLLPEWDLPEGFDARETARTVAAQIGALECTAEWPAVVELAGRYPSLPGSEFDGIKSSLEAGMEWERASLLREFRGIATAPPDTDPLKLRQWLNMRRGAYVKLLSRI